MIRRQFVTTALHGLTLTLAACGRTGNGTVPVYVSILPMKYFVERIGGGRITAGVMAGPGQNPATYEPLPRQMLELANARIFFRIGVPFEDAWLETIASNNPDLAIVDLRKGIELHAMDTVTDITADMGGGHNVDAHADHDHGGGPDPHIWLSPRLVKRQAETICDALCELDPAAADIFQENLLTFQADLDHLHDDIASVLEQLPTRRMMVFHPAWGYFAREFGMSQLPIEIEGKEPGPRELAMVIDMAHRENIAVIFVQQQFASDAARAIADAIHGAVVSVDPLAEDYLDNMRAVAGTIASSLGETAHD